MTSLDLTGCTKLNVLECSNNQLTSLEVEDNCSPLFIFDCSNNQLSELNVPAVSCAHMGLFDCSHNKLVSLTIGRAKVGYIEPTGPDERFDCSNNLLTSFVPLAEFRVQTFDCSNNEIAALDPSGFGLVNTIECYDNPLEESAVDALKAWQAELDGRTLVLERPLRQS